MVKSTHILRAGVTALGVTALTVSAGVAHAASPAAAPKANVTISGAGSTFIAPLLQGAVIPGFTKANPNISVDYQSIGSGAGISLFAKGSVNFAGSDALLNGTQDSLLKTQCGGGQAGGVLKIPTTIGAVAIIFHLEGVHTGLRLTPDVLTNIFEGKITSWSDPSIKALNSTTALPNVPIQTVHRSDGSGTTYIFTHYLSDVAPSWNKANGGPGAGTTVVWPGANALGASKSAGVSAAVNQTNGAVSYVDLAYAVQNNLSYAYVQNSSKQFVAPSSSSASIAADGFAKTMPSDLQQLIVNSSAKGAYPVSGYSYIFLCRHESGSIGKAVVSFVRYAVTTGQSFATQLYYAPLPKSVQKLDLAALPRS